MIEGGRKSAVRGRQQVRPAQIGIAVTAGALIGVGSLALDRHGAAGLLSAARPLAVSVGILRAREPQPGDSWRGCGHARAAGTTPLYRGEPGYRDALDGDHDGVACEPYRSWW